MRPDYQAFPPRAADAELDDPGEPGFTIASFKGVAHLEGVYFPTKEMADAVAAELNEAFSRGEAHRAKAIAALLQDHL